MAAITYSPDGTNIFIAAEDSSTGFQVVLKAAVTDFTTWTAVYSPGAGSAANVMASPTNSDIIYFYGNFDTDVVILEHTISTGAEVDISPASLGAKEVNVLAVNPTALYDGSIEIVAHVNTDSDVIYSDDSGATWTTWDATSGMLPATALEVVWGGNYFPHGYIIAGNFIGTANVVVSPNEGASNSAIPGITATDFIGIQFTGT